MKEMNEIELNKIEVGENQPRSYIDTKKIIDLANDIKENGLLQPIVVRKKGNKFEVVCGHRRFEAHRRLKAKTISCIIKDMNDINAFLTSIRENIQREEMSLFDESRAYKKLMSNGLTQMDIAKKLNISQSKISQALAISKFDGILFFNYYNTNKKELCKENAVETAIISQLITPSHAQELLKLVRFFEEIGLEKNMWSIPLQFKLDEIVMNNWSTGDLRYAIDNYICGFVDMVTVRKNLVGYQENPLFKRYEIPFKYLEMSLKFHVRHRDFDLKEGEIE